MNFIKGGSAKSKIFMIFIIIIIITIFLTQLGLVYLKFKREEVLRKWDTYKCSPIILPIAGKIKPGVDTGALQQECFSKFFISLFNGKILSQMPIFGMIERTLGESNNQMAFFDGFFDDIGTFFDAATTSLYEKMDDFLQVIIFSFLKIKNIFGRINSAMRLQLYALEAIRMTMISVWDGPIGEGVRDFADVYDTVDDFFSGVFGPRQSKVKEGDDKAKNECFIGDTIIDGIKIKDMKFKKYKNNNIYGMVICQSYDDIYNYNGVYLTGSHYVYHKNKYRRVHDLGIKKNNNNNNGKGNIVYCPITDNQQIKINNDLFLDYFEINTNYYLHRLLMNLNGKKTKFYNISRFMGLNSDTNIKMNNYYKKISDIQIGDILYDNNKVIGIVKVLSKNTNIYKFKDTIISGRQLIFINNKWINIESVVSNNEKIDNEITLYSLITKNNTFYTENLLVRDFEESKDDSINRLVENTINKVF